MTAWIVAGFMVAGFLVLIRVLKLVEGGREVIGLARRVVGVVRSDQSDEAKESELQTTTKRLLLLFLLLTLGGGIALLAPAGVLWVFDWFGWIEQDPVYEVMVSPLFIAVTSVLAIGFLFVPRRSVPKSDYSLVERCLHHVAFQSKTAQIALADVEDRVYAKSIAECSAGRPAFITGLPRAGTTLLLECCNRLPEFATHCYRDMPFVLTPCFWNRFSAVFRRGGQKKERAHGDGMLIDFDSPEALEEVIWSAFWKRKYQTDRIAPWSDEDDEEFTDFFRSHIRKIISLRAKDPSTARYISKNNLNISRISTLRRVFPDAIVIVPFREPVFHAASLLEQHLNFLRIHAEDPFARKYMRAIGHYDFGANLRPVDFDGWFDNRRSQDATTLSFWLEYWIAAYRHLLAQDAEMFFLDYAALCADPTATLRRLGNCIGSNDETALIEAGADIRSPRAREVDTSPVDESVLRDAEGVYRALCDQTSSSPRS